MEKWQWTERLNPRKKKRGLKRRLKRMKKLIALHNRYFEEFDKNSIVLTFMIDLTENEKEELNERFNNDAKAVENLFDGYTFDSERTHDKIDIAVNSDYLYDRYIEILNGGEE